MVIKSMFNIFCLIASDSRASKVTKHYLANFTRWVKLSDSNLANKNLQKALVSFEKDTQ